MSDEAPKSEIILYQTEDGVTRLQVKMENETVWLTQAQMAELFQRERSVITKHIRNIFEEGELVEDSVCANFAQTAADGKTYQTVYYNLDVIISVGYRVKSLRGTQFRIWATQRLREYIVKGFTMDDERLKQAGGYFEELLARIRDIRSSERVFWRKVLDIYATSADYDARSEAAQEFFATVQNKMHWATHGRTAAEVLRDRADAEKPNMGLTSWPGARIRKADVGIAKNYLTQPELEILNRLVNQYLEFAELQALSRKVMVMQDWARRLDDFMRFNERELLRDAGSISHEDALRLAEREYERFHALQLAQPQAVDADFEQAVKKLEAAGKPPAPKPGKKKE